MAEKQKVTMNFRSGHDTQGLELPPLDDDAVVHSARLAKAIAERIESRGGVIGFDEYMHMVLYQPGLGYYASTSPKFGIQGDFITAPEISPLFGYCIAQQAAAAIEQGCGARVLEFGAGSGKLCAQILEALPGLEAYQIIDLSADLRQRQQAHLQQELSAELFHKIEWLSRLPLQFDGIVLANEVLDAMPVHILSKHGEWRECGVGYDGQRFSWHYFVPQAPVMDAIRSIEARLGEFADGYTCELNLNYRPWFKALAEACQRALIMIIDYGYEQDQYYHPARASGTLTCHYRHRVHGDPLVYPGLQDITAFVDFDACADAAEENGFELSGLVNQGSFLVANGLLEESQRLVDESDTLTRTAISKQVGTLTLPQEMGEKFKVLAMQKNIALELPAMRRKGAHG